MKRTIVAIGLCVALTTLVAALDRSGARYSDLTPASQQAAVKITNGPGIDRLTDTSAEVFWNTNAERGGKNKPQPVRVARAEVEDGFTAR
ncbi:MAG: hypothetical protein ACE14L_15970 [Terriglobales bacterium]